MNLEDDFAEISLSLADPGVPGASGHSPKRPTNFFCSAKHRFWGKLTSYSGYANAKSF